jgi:ring-1,2-phenylacetyl-CoA epoxidase subunit PaaE
MTTIELQVVAIRREATEMVTIALRRRDGLPLEYRAGQFLTLLFLFGERELRRSYSFSSTPGVDEFPAITVKRVTNGEVSRQLIDHLAVGDVLRSLPPAGLFALAEGFAGTLVFLAAGSGMVPVFSLIKAAAFGRPGSRGMAQARMVLITQNRDEASIPFASELGRLVADEKLEWTSLLSGVAPVARLNNGLLQEMLKDIRGDEHFFLCGPAGFMRMAVFTLRWMGVADEQIKRENFTVEYHAPPPVLADTRPKRVVVEAGREHHEFTVTWPATILQSALDQGIALPYSCKGGVCSSCVARCVSGRVKMRKNEVLTERDIAEGLVLTCVGYAETDVELRLGTDPMQPGG